MNTLTPKDRLLLLDLALYLVEGALPRRFDLFVLQLQRLVDSQMESSYRNQDEREAAQYELLTRLPNALRFLRPSTGYVPHTGPEEQDSDFWNQVTGRTSAVRDDYGHPV